MNMGLKNLNKSFAIIAALLMAFCAFAVLAVDDSDADASIGDLSASGFKKNQSGTLTVTVRDCIENEVIHLVVTDNNDGSVVKTYDFAATEGTNVVDLKFKLSEGEHNIVVNGTSSTGSTLSGNQIAIECGDNIWTHVSSYVVIVILILVVVIIAVVYMRARPNNKPSTTFTQLEKEKKAASSAKEPSAPVKTEKVKYSSSRRK